MKLTICMLMFVYLVIPCLTYPTLDGTRVTEPEKEDKFSEKGPIPEMEKTERRRRSPQELEMGLGELFQRPTVEPTTEKTPEVTRYRRAPQIETMPLLLTTQQEQVLLASTEEEQLKRPRRSPQGMGIEMELGSLFERPTEQPTTEKTPEVTRYRRAPQMEAVPVLLAAQQEQVLAASTEASATDEEQPERRRRSPQGMEMEYLGGLFERPTEQPTTEQTTLKEKTPDVARYRRAPQAEVVPILLAAQQEQVLAASTEASATEEEEPATEETASEETTHEGTRFRRAPQAEAVPILLAAQQEQESAAVTEAPATEEETSQRLRLRRTAQMNPGQSPPQEKSVTEQSTTEAPEDSTHPGSRLRRSDQSDQGRIQDLTTVAPDNESAPRAGTRLRRHPQLETIIGVPPTTEEPTTEAPEEPTTVDPEDSTHAGSRLRRSDQSVLTTVAPDNESAPRAGTRLRRHDHNQMTPQQEQQQETTAEHESSTDASPALEQTTQKIRSKRNAQLETILYPATTEESTTEAPEDSTHAGSRLRRSDQSDQGRVQDLTTVAPDNESAPRAGTRLRLRRGSAHRETEADQSQTQELTTVRPSTEAPKEPSSEERASYSDDQTTSEFRRKLDS